MVRAWALCPISGAGAGVAGARGGPPALRCRCCVLGLLFLELLLELEHLIAT